MWPYRVLGRDPVVTGTLRKNLEHNNSDSKNAVELDNNRLHPWIAPR